MKVLYDHQIFQIQKVGGISRGLVEIISHFNNNIDYEISIKESDNIYLQSYSLKHDSKKTTRTRESFLSKYEFKGKTKLYNFIAYLNLLHTTEYANLQYSIEKIKQGNFDVFHPTYFSNYFVDYLQNKPFVLTVHDLTPELFPQFFLKNDFQREMRKKLIPLAAHIIVRSEFTKKTLLNRWTINPEKITVAYAGAPAIDRNKVSKRLFNFKYILFVGLRGGYKNFNFFIDQSIDFLIKNHDIHIVCTGKQFTQEELELFIKMGIINRVHSIFATDDEMISLYKYALCLVFPSLNEGFGLPTLEAFSCGCPVLLYNGSCHPEIGGDAAFYFDIINGESDVSDKLSIINSLSYDERCNIINKGYRMLNKFSWSKCSEKYFNVYNSIVK